LELVYDDADSPPRVRFLTEMWHPHSKFIHLTNPFFFFKICLQVTKDGIPFYWIPPGTKEPVIPILLALQKLLRTEPNSSSATWVNLDAAKQYFSKKEEEKKEYKKKVGQCVRKSVEG
jgi:ubiquitin-protein ligase